MSDTFDHELDALEDAFYRDDYPTPLIERKPND